MNLTLTRLGESSSFTGNFSSLEKGNFTVDILVKDIFDNEAIYSDASSVLTTDITTDLNNGYILHLIIGSISGISILALAIIVVLFRR